VAVTADLLVPSHLAATADEVWGEVGRRWIARLPETVRSLVADWGLELGEPLPMSIHWVCAATTAEGSPAVLKIGPAAPGHLPVEARALRLFDGSGSVRLLQEDQARGALLLERAVPGDPLSRLVPRHDEEATAVLVDVLRTLHRPAPADLPDVLVQRDDLDVHLRTDGLLPARLVDRAAGLFTELSADAMERVVLHGDLHHDNVLRAERAPWLSIDPHGSAGDPGYDVGSMLHNPVPPHRDPDLLSLLPRRVEQLADGLGMDTDRVVAWGFVKAVLSQVWSCELPAPEVTRALDVALSLEPCLR
jgi:streptomycin 6-kinase